MTSTQSEALLSITGLTTGYDGLAVVRDLDLTVSPGEVVALLGPNGAGKSTTLLAAVGELPLIAGTVDLFGEPRRQLFRNANAGLAFVPEEKSVIMRLSVMDNLRLGTGDPRIAFDLFPELAKLKYRCTGLLSGGEQQMLTLGRALAAQPRLLIADEISLGLGPLIVTRLLAAIRSYVDATGAGALIIEQQARRALSVSDRWVLMRRGQIAAHGLAASGLGAAEASFLAAGDPVLISQIVEDE